ncbi:MAG: hypothetical protein KGJ06_04320, partial [Pseudomonadota bacterium]|nr:hypothetical protein [Pseudomonadota bacterium]
MRHFIETHFGLVLALSCVAGLAIPAIGRLPDVSVVWTLAALMFVSCYRLHEGGLKAIAWRDIAWFYLLRYAALPLILWLIAHALAPAYASGVFLLSVLPAAVASPAFANIYGGSLPPAFAIAVVTQLAAPFLIPLMFALLGEGQVTPPPLHLFSTMVWCILLPMLAYAILRRHRRSAAYIHSRNRLFSVLLVAFIIALAVAKQREVILSSGAAVAAALIVTALCFLCYIAFGWFLLKRP